MPRFVHVATHVSSKARYSSNITDMALVDTGQGTVLLTVSNKDAGFAAYILTGPDAPARGVTQEKPLDHGVYYDVPQLEVIRRDTNDFYIIMSGQDGSIHKPLRMTGDGNLKTYVPLFSPQQIPGDIVEMKILDIAGQNYLLAAGDRDMGLGLYRFDDFSPVALGTASPRVPTTADSEYSDIEVLHIGRMTYAFTVSEKDDLITVYAVDTGGIRAMSSVSDARHIGINAPRDAEVITTENGNFLVVTGGLSNSLTVFHINASGELTLMDHVIDSKITRFEAVTAIDTAEVDGRAYIFAGGGDGGISVLTLDGQGRLVLLDVLVDSQDIVLASVSSIEAMVIDDKVALFVVSSTESGVTQLSFDPGKTGLSWVGSGRKSGSVQDDILVGTGRSSILSGAAGDDILVAREGIVTIKGGAGADIFIPGYAAKSVIIVDFVPGYDKLDLSEITFIRSVAQLQVVPTATGAFLMAGETTIEIRTENGRTLKAADFADDMFRLSHYVNNIDYSGLVTSPQVSPSPSLSTPGTSPEERDDIGRYTHPSPLPLPATGASTVYGTAKPEQIRSRAEGGVADGLAGNDTLFGGGFSDYLYGGSGNDSLVGGNGHDMIEGGEGDDIILGGAGDDRIYGFADEDIIFAEGGNDIIYGGPGDDLLHGGDGSDLITDYAGTDTIIGGQGHDWLLGSGDGVKISGGDGNDLISASGQGGILKAGQGHDTVFGSLGGDTIHLGAGNDDARGRNGNDFIAGHRGDDSLFGHAGDDFLLGHNGNDRLFGGKGDDRLRGGNGDDLIRGQLGHDSVRGDAGNDLIYGGIGNDQMTGGDGDDLISGQADNDIIHGDAGNDLLYGGDGYDKLDGDEGDDHIRGDGGADRLEGGQGNDVLLGGSGNDKIGGGSGKDTLDGGDGHDVLTGGAMEDVFIFTASSSRGTARAETIKDFQSGVDQIDLSALRGSMIWIGSADFTGSDYLEIRAQIFTTKTRVSVDIDGDRTADIVIDVYGSGVSPFDFMF